MRRQLKELSLKSPDAVKLTAICRDKKLSVDTRCDAAGLLGTLELMGAFPRRRYSLVTDALLKNIRENEFVLVWPPRPLSSW